jgi:HD-GYP domain-containing protein (c-di-GMP phosphodiesterase class II)
MREKMLQKTDVNDLCPGMYVSGVLKQKGNIKLTSSGRINSDKDITSFVKKGILQVEIDLTKSTHLQAKQELTMVKDDYRNGAGLSYSEQMNLTLELYDQAKEIHGRIIRNIGKGRINNIEDVEDISRNIVDKTFECEDAITVVTLLNNDNDYLLEHSINCAILMTMLGKQLGLDRELLHELGIGALLMDIGMSELPLLLTQKSEDLTEKEMLKIQGHVDAALSIVEKLDNISDVSLAVIGQHHERLDGSGYPGAFKGEQISLYGRMAAITDTYDSLTADRPYRKALTPADALIKMSNQELGLDAQLIEQFILCIGLNPVGSIVRLDSAKLAMVIRINKEQPMHPVVMVFYDLTGKHKEAVRQVNLATTEDKIIGSIPPAEFNIELGLFLKEAFAPGS